MSYQVIPNEQPIESIQTIVEQNRYKGQGLFRKKPIEELSYLKLVLWPIRHFEISTRKSNKTSDNIFAVRDFMLGLFSIPYINQILKNEGGRNALKVIFSRENQALLSTRTSLKGSYPALPFYQPIDVYNQLYKSYVDNKIELENQLDQVIKDMEPVLVEADEYKKKADILKMKIDTFKGNKKSSIFKDMKSSYSSNLKLVKQLRKQAQSAIKNQERKVQNFTKKWNRGLRRFLGLNKNSEIVKFGDLGTFYQMYWVARLDSSSSTRYLVLDKETRQVRKIQNMLNFDDRLRNELDSILHFKKFSSRISCFYCGTQLENNTQTCPNCSQKIQRCSVCKLPISKDDQTASCPKCKSIAHLSHLHEWVKTQGKCPTCLQEIKLRNIIMNTDLISES
ncbi:MAG: hypothetical protein FK734_15430 [Asgard group archaeon]|nr:hypothetical protein [Asgard group archaeon]